MIQDNNLFGNNKYEDIAKNHIVNSIIEGETNSERINFGAIIITTEDIGYDIVNKYNTRQISNINDGNYEHKILCERKVEPAALIFVTIHELLGDIRDSYKTMEKKEVSTIALKNLQFILKRQIPWITKYTKYVLKTFYDLTSKLKIKFNFIMDDLIYDDSPNSSKGGLLTNGFLDELDYYDCNVKKYTGAICQVFIPSGLPRDRKWTQIDVGISISGKRLYQETIKDGLLRKIMQMGLHVDPNIIANAKGYPYSKKLYYGGAKNGNGIEGHEIDVLEIVYEDQLQLIDEQTLDYNFCKCKEREILISQKI